VYENMLGLGLKLAWKVVIDEMLSAFHLLAADSSSSSPNVVVCLLSVVIKLKNAC